MKSRVQDVLSRKKELNSLIESELVELIENLWEENQRLTTDNIRLIEAVAAAKLAAEKLKEQPIQEDFA